MALLHEKMQQQDDTHKGVDVQEYFNTLITELIKSYAVGKDIRSEINIDVLELDMDTLTPLGLIVNELITNSLKYGFVERNKGLVIVQIKQLSKNSFEMLIGDDGVGFSLAENHENLGTKLIRIFIKQLNRSIVLLNEPGTMYKIIFQKGSLN